MASGTLVSKSEFHCGIDKKKLMKKSLVSPLYEGAWKHHLTTSDYISLATPTVKEVWEMESFN